MCRETFTEYRDGLKGRAELWVCADLDMVAYLVWVKDSLLQRSRVSGLLVADDWGNYFRKSIAFLCFLHRVPEPNLLCERKRTKMLIVCIGSKYIWNDAETTLWYWQSGDPFWYTQETSVCWWAVARMCRICHIVPCRKASELRTRVLEEGGNELIDLNRTLLKWD